MPNELTGGTKLTTTASVEFGFCTIGHHNIHGTIIMNINGIISCCASRMSLTAAPTAIISEPIVKNVMK